MGWYKSLILHPLVNRFNILFVMGWAIACWSTTSPWPFWIGLIAEGLYFGARLALEFSGRPLWQLRFLKKDSRERYFKLIERFRQIKRDFANVDALRPLLEGQIRHIKKMTGVFLELLILRSRIDSYVTGIRENYDQKIAEIKEKMPRAEGRIREILEQNLKIYEQRRAKYFEVMGNRAVIEARLDTIENTLNLLGDYAMGMAAPGEAHDQVELLVSNIRDAENFVSEIKTVVPQSSSIRVRVKA